MPPTSISTSFWLVAFSGREVTGGWQEHHLALPPATPESFLLTLRASPTFRPFSEFRRLEPPIPSLDVRELGVAMRQVRWETRPQGLDGAGATDKKKGSPASAGPP